jgi:hypothetical protein
MKRISTVALLAALSTAGLSAQMAHGPTAAPAPYAGPASEVQRSYNGLKGNIVKAAEKMPAEDYGYKAGLDIRTYARVVNHVTEAQSATCSALLGTKMDPSMVPADTADKATIVTALKASFDLCDKAYEGLTDANVTEAITIRNGKRSRIGAAWGNVSHDNEQYAILSFYLRIKGLVAPTPSEK